MEELLKRRSDVESLCADGKIPNFEVLRQKLLQSEVKLKDVLVENKLFSKKRNTSKATLDGLD